MINAFLLLIMNVIIILIVNLDVVVAAERCAVLYIY